MKMMNQKKKDNEKSISKKKDKKKNKPKKKDNKKIVSEQEDKKKNKPKKKDNEKIVSEQEDKKKNKPKKKDNERNKVLEDYIKSIMFDFGEYIPKEKTKNKEETSKEIKRQPQELKIVKEIIWVDNPTEIIIRNEKNKILRNTKKVITFDENTKKRIGKVIYKTSKTSYIRVLFAKEIIPKKTKIQKTKSNIKKPKVKKPKIEKPKIEKELEESETNENFKVELKELTEKLKMDNSIKRKYQRKNDVERYIALLNRKYELQKHNRQSHDYKIKKKLKKKITKHVFQLSKKSDSMHPNEISAIYKRNYSRHALMRMKKREISYENIENTINKGKKISNGDGTIYYKNKNLKVIVAEINGTIITTYRDNKIF